MEEQRRQERFLYEQLAEMERERRIEDEKMRETHMRRVKGQEKNEKIQYKVDEAYRKMEEWQRELARREQQAEENRKRQQQLVKE